MKGLIKKKGKKKRAEEPVTKDTKYFNVKKLVNKLLYGFDQSQMHKIEKIDPDRFNFVKVSNLSIDTEENENQFLIVLWQLAASLTRETVEDKHTLPLINETDVQNKEDESV